MLKNKKLAIRLVALVLTLVMAAAMFVGCSSKKLQEELDLAKADAEAAKQAAANAQDAANSAADAASELVKQLEDVQKAAADAIEAAKAAESEAKDAQSKLESVVSGTKPVDDNNIGEGEWKDATADIAKITNELAQLRAKHLTIRYLWYTEANYLRLAQLFEDADADIYRATSPEGLSGVMTKLNADIAAIANIQSDSDPVQAQIQAFGDIDADLFMSHKANVEKARADYKEWLVKYSSYFTANGLDVNDYDNKKGAIDAFVMRTFGLGANNIRYAESKLATLKTYADKVSKDAYDAISAIWGATSYSTIKGRHKVIQAAYELYKRFVVANGGDDTPITFEDKDNKRVLTGEQFVKQYVLVLYDNWLSLYQSAAKTYIDSLPQFFMNTGDAAGNFAGLDAAYLGIYEADETKVGNDYKVAFGAFAEQGSTNQQLLNEFEKIATLNASEVLKLSYSKDFKGTESLEDAYAKIENAISKALVEMATLYYEKIALVAVKDQVNALKTNVATLASSTDTVYKTFDIAYADEYKLAADAAVAAIEKIRPNTYAALVADKTIKLGELTTFVKTVDANGELDFTSAGTYSGAALEAILKDMNAAVKKATASYAEIKAELADSIAFYEFRKDLVTQLNAYVATMDAEGDAIFTNIDAVRGSSNKVTKAEAEALGKANTTTLDAYRSAVMALKYDDFAAATYQGSTGKKSLYYNAAATDTAKTTETAKDNKALTIQVDKIVVAKNAAVKMYGEHANQMFEKLLDLCRTQATTLINNSVESYRTNYAGDATIDTLNLKAEVENYITYLNGLIALKSVDTFKLTNFSLADNTIKAGVTLDALGYKLEVIKANSEYLLHVADYEVVANITNTGDNSYLTLSVAQVTSFRDRAINSYKSLEDVRHLAYYKDNAILTLKDNKNSFVGVYDSKTDSLIDVRDGYEYNYYSSRKVMYLAALEDVYNRVVAEINKITLPNSSHTLTTAQGKVDTIRDYHDDLQDNKKKADSNDDLSFAVAYYRYYKTKYEVGEDPYDWAKYNA